MTEEEGQAPDLSALFDWDGESELPEPLRPLAEHRDLLKGHIEKVTGETAARAQEDIRRQMREQAEREKAIESTRASTQEDIDFAEQIQRDLLSTDEAVRNAATERMQQNESRYTRGLAKKLERTEESVFNKALDRHYMALLKALHDDGQKELVDFFSSPENLAPYQGNTLRAAFEFGKQQGDTSGYERGLEEGRREVRGEQNGSGTPAAQPPLGGGGKSSFTEGVQLGSPGSTQQLKRRFAGSRN